MTKLRPLNKKAKTRFDELNKEFETSLVDIADHLANRDKDGAIDTKHLDQARGVLAPNPRRDAFQQGSQFVAGLTIGVAVPGFVDILDKLNAGAEVSTVVAGIYVTLAVVGVVAAYFGFIAENY